MCEWLLCVEVVSLGVLSEIKGEGGVVVVGLGELV